MNDQTEFLPFQVCLKSVRQMQSLSSDTSKSVGKYNLIYTRSVQGRPVLLEARIKALGNKQERTVTHKKLC